MAAMVTVQNVMVNALWLVGLAGLLATAGYLNWYRELTQWSWRHLLSLPRVRMPLALSLMLIAVGAALADLTGKRHDSGWITAAWCILSFLLFILFIQTVFFARAGDQHGWDSSTEGDYRQ